VTSKPSSNSFAILNDDINDFPDDNNHQVKDPPTFPHANARSQSLTQVDMNEPTKPSSASSYTSIDCYMGSYANATKRNLPRDSQPNDDSPTSPVSLDDRFHSVLRMIQLQQTQMTNADTANKIRYNQLDSTTSLISRQLEESNKNIMKQLGSQNNVLNELITSSMSSSGHPTGTKQHQSTSSIPTPKIEPTDMSKGPDPTHDCPTVPTTHMSNPSNKVHSLEQQTDSTHKFSNHQGSPNIFGTNKFSLACTGKIKFSEIESSLKTKQLKDDSDIQMERFYSGLIQSICYVFESGLNIIPSFLNLDKNINFKKIFLHNLIGSNLQKCRQIYN
jgi:hypothetical protein